MPQSLTRRQYAEMFGPTVGDRVRLADTELFIQVERELSAQSGGIGDEVQFGGGKVIRNGMGQSSTATDAESLDLVITNALVLDAPSKAASKPTSAPNTAGSSGSGTQATRASKRGSRRA